MKLAWRWRSLAIALAMTTEAGAEPLRPRIVGGAPAPAALNSLSICELTADESDCLSSCGATLIAPNLALTARHCAAVASAQPLDCKTYRFDGQVRPADRVYVSASAAIGDGGARFRGARWDLPLATSCGHDLALLVLAEPVPSSVAMPAEPKVADDTVSRSETLTMFGFGRTSPDVPSDGVRRSSTANLLCRGGIDPCSSVPGGSELLPSEFAMNAEVCTGDSGSGAFAGPLLVGTLSRTIGGTPTCGYGVYGTVTAHRLLLARAARSAAEAGKYELPSWVAIAEAAGNGGGVAARAFGAPCDGDRDCASNLCRSDDAGFSWQCVSTCADACCKATNDGSYCFRGQSPSPDDGCHASRSSKPLPIVPAAVSLLVLGFLGRRRCS